MIATIKTQDKARSIAVLYQANEPPILNSIRKPMKTGGYCDSGADIAYNLQALGLSVITPTQDPDPKMELDWVFPDTEQGIQRALLKGATVFWANTILFKGHPLEKLALEPNVFVIGQLPILVQQYDNKWVANQKLRAEGLTIAPACLISHRPIFSDSKQLNWAHLSIQQLHAQGLDFPLIIKPVAGRGSQGVYLVLTMEELKKRVNQLWSEKKNINGQLYPKYGETFILEQYLPGQEVTITVMPPGNYFIKNQEQHKLSYWSLPIVKRFNHINGVVPYSGDVAVLQNSALLNDQEMKDIRYEILKRECEKAAELFEAKGPIRIDCREGIDQQFYLFDINMKPNMTGPGRPGRGHQDSLTLIAAQSKSIQWDYKQLLFNIYLQAWPSSLMLKY